MHCYVALSNVNVYEDVYPLFTTKKGGQLLGMFVFYCAIRFSVVPYDSLFCWYQIFMDFVKFLIHDNL